MNGIRVAAGMLPGHWFKGGLSERGGANRCGIGWLFQATRGGLDGDMRVSLSDELRMIHVMGEAARDKFPERIEHWFDASKIGANGSGGGMYPFAQFNDHENTSEADVLAVMELAAERWEIERGE